MSWTIPDSNPDGQGFVAIILLFLFLDIFGIAIRLYSRYLQAGQARHPIDLSNYVLIGGVIMTVGLVVVMWATYSHGYGMNITKFTQEDAEISSKLFPATDITWNTATTLIRISMILLYSKIFSPVRSFKILCLAMIFLNILNCIAIILASSLICHPLSYIYLRAGNGTCGNVKALETYGAVASIVFDGAVVVSPLPMLWRLQMKRKRKAAISLILGLGVLIVALTIFRLVISYAYEPPNLTKQSAIVDLVTGLEPTLGILIACLPFFPTPLQRLASRFNVSLFSSSKKSKTTGTAGSGPLSSGVGMSGPAQGKGFRKLNDGIELGYLGEPREGLGDGRWVSEERGLGVGLFGRELRVSNGEIDLEGGYAGEKAGPNKDLLSSQPEPVKRPDEDPAHILVRRDIVTKAEGAQMGM
ncbi:MAG: hypothetical protein M1828_007069 [Chrysothrix sp. TS-e1954]|nr:MAG: hypothetical protein M1828_007069 [Chrysothrix sp. TS-e1954]